MQERETVGAVATKLLQEADGKQGVVDTEREANKEYLEQVYECVQNAVKNGWDKPFYVVVISKKERVLENVMRRYFVARKTMPMPDYDQSVFLFDPKTEQLRYFWTLPDANTCEYLLHNDVDPQETQLKAFVHAFVDDKLYDHFAGIYEIHNEWAAEAEGNATKIQQVIGAD